MCSRKWLACALRCLSLRYWKDPLDWLSIGSAQLFQGVLRSDHGLQFQLHGEILAPFQPVWGYWMKMEKTAGCCGILLTTGRCVEKGKGTKAKRFFSAWSGLPMLGVLQLGLVTDAIFHLDNIKVMTCPDMWYQRVQSWSTSLAVACKDAAPLEDIPRDFTFAQSIYADRGCEACFRYLDMRHIPHLVIGSDILVTHLIRFTDWTSLNLEQTRLSFPSMRSVTFLNILVEVLLSYYMWFSIAAPECMATI